MLGEEDEEDITMQVAAPPKEFAENRMQTISQLDKDAKYHLPSESTIDLSMLTMSLSPADKVRQDNTRHGQDTAMTCRSFARPHEPSGPASQRAIDSISLAK